jgi:TetR/AcrR family transcriptional repressor of mexJK operon
MIPALRKPYEQKRPRVVPSNLRDDAGSMLTRLSQQETKPGRPSKAEAARRLEHVFTVARRSFLEKGYGATSLEAIAREAGVAKKTIYRHFADKAALFGAILARLSAEWVAELEDIADVTRPPGDVLHDIGLRLLEVATRPDAIGLHRLMFAEAQRFPELARAYHANGTRYGLKPLKDYLKAQTAGGVLAIDDPTLAAEQFAYGVLGAIRMRIVLGVDRPPGPAKRLRIVQQAVRIFLGGCRARDGHAPPAR